MDQKITNSQLQLKRKGEQLKCQEHKENIISLNIGPDLPLNQRLTCSECYTFGQKVLPLKQAEQYLSQWYSNEQSIVQQEQQHIEGNVNIIKTQIMDIQRLFDNYISMCNMKIAQIQRNFNEKIRIFSQNLENVQQKLDSELKNKLNTKISDMISNIIDGKLVLKYNLDIDQIKDQIQKSKIKMLTDLFQIKSILQPLDYDTFKYKSPIHLEGNQYQKEIGAVALSHNEQLIASGNHNGQVILWDLQKKIIKQKYQLKAEIQDLCFSFNDKLLAAVQVSTPCDILLFDLTNLTQNQPSIILKGHQTTVNKIKFTQNFKFLVSGSQDQTLKIWSLDQQECISDKNLSYDIWDVSISQDEKFISASCNGGSAYLFDSSNIQENTQLVEWKAHNLYAYGTTFTPDSQMVLTCGDGDLKLWNIEQLLLKEKEKTPFKVFQAFSNSKFWSIAVRLNGSTLISNDGQIRIWNMESGNLIQTLDVPGGYQYTQDYNFSVSQDMKYIITGGNTKLKIYELSLTVKAWKD